MMTLFNSVGMIGGLFSTGDWMCSAALFTVFVICDLSKPNIHFTFPINLVVCHYSKNQTFG